MADAAYIVVGYVLSIAVVSAYMISLRREIAARRRRPEGNGDA